MFFMLCLQLDTTQLDSLRFNVQLYGTGSKCTSPECPLNTGTHLWAAPIADLYACIAEANRRIDALHKTAHSLKMWECEEANRIDDCEEKIRDIEMKMGLLPKPASGSSLAEKETVLPDSEDKNKDEVLDDSKDEGEKEAKRRRLEEGDN